MPRPILFDTNLVIQHIRRKTPMPAEVVLSMVVMGELEAFALKADWGYQKVNFMQHLFAYHPLLELSRIFNLPYARIDAYSQGKLTRNLLLAGLLGPQHGQNDLSIAATALYFDVELHTSDNDFDHPAPLSLRVVKS